VQTFDFLEQIPDADPTETARLICEIERSIAAHGPERAKLLLMRLLARARDLGVDLPTLVTTPYINTIKTSDEPAFRPEFLKIVAQAWRSSSAMIASRSRQSDQTSRQASVSMARIEPWCRGDSITTSWRPPASRSSSAASAAGCPVVMG
jgi:hypothetical protein